MNTKHPLFPFQVFRAYDIRGKVSLLTPEVVHSIALGLVKQYVSYGLKKIVLGYDARLTSASYAGIIQQVFEDHQFEVNLIGCCSSPLMYFSARQNGGNGIMVTASHNPVSDNGIKWIIHGLPPTPEMIQDVAESAHQQFSPELTPKFKSIQQGSLEFYCNEYIQHLVSDIKIKRKLKVVIDGLNGSAGHCAVKILEKLGCDVIAIRCDANGHFPDHAPDPSKEIHLNKLKEAVIQSKADIGIALDGDGDRLVLVDEQAKLIRADRILSLCAEMCLKLHPHHEVVFDVKCSTMVRNTVRNLGGIPIMIRTGSSFLRKYLSNSQGRAVFGGEYAGHYVFNDHRGFGYDDGLYAGLRVLEYFSESNSLKISELFAKYPERYSTEDTYISTHNAEPICVLHDVESLSQNLDAELSKIDGIRLDFEDGFGIIRASNTGEYFTVRFDADNPSRLNDIRHTFVTMLSDRYPKIAQDILDAQ